MEKGYSKMSLHDLHKFALVQYCPSIFFDMDKGVLQLGNCGFTIKRVFDEPYLFYFCVTYEFDFEIVVFDELLSHGLRFK